MAPRTPLVNAPLAALIVAASLALTTASALAQGGPPPGKGGGGHTETATTNLSYPAVFTGTAPTLNGTEGAWKLTGLFGETWSYGCAIPVEEFPNTSCMNADGTFMSYDQCAAVCVNAEGLPVAVERMYWQKEGTAVQWQAGSLTISEGQSKWSATYLDWGDNLESQTWSTTSVVRVETTPFTTLPVDDSGNPIFVANQMGFQMWHVSGKGPDEMWGVRTTNEDSPRPFTYESPYAIIHAPNAHLALTKLATGGATCPTTFAPSPFGTLLWDTQLDVWYSQPEGGARTETCTYADLAYTVELNIGGKFVHGYNWQMSRVPAQPCPGYAKEGWWRLTYHGVNEAVDFSGFVNDLANLMPPVIVDVPEPPTALLAGPQLAGPLFAGPRFMLQAAEAAEAEADTGPLYRPVVDTVNNITYIDICLNPGKGGGGRR